MVSSSHRIAQGRKTKITGARIALMLTQVNAKRNSLMHFASSLQGLLDGLRWRSPMPVRRERYYFGMKISKTMHRPRGDGFEPTWMALYNAAL